MSSSIRILFACLAMGALVGTGVVHAQSNPTGGISDSPSGVITDATTPDLADGEAYQLSFDVHAQAPGVANWAGVRVSVHLLDNQELDIVSVVHEGTPIGGGPVTVVSPFGAHSNNAQSVPQLFTVFDPNWGGSGVNLAASQNVNVLDINIQAKNGASATNGDIDLSLAFSNIFHMPPNQAGTTTFYQVPQSANLLVPQSINDYSDFFQAFHDEIGFPQSNFILPGSPATPGTGHWIHLDNDVTFRVPSSAQGSVLWASAANSAVVRVNHVIPEPAGAVMAVLGGGALLLWVRARRKRLRAHQ